MQLYPDVTSQVVQPDAVLSNTGKIIIPKNVSINSLLYVPVERILLNWFRMNLQQSSNTVRPQDNIVWTIL